MSSVKVREDPDDNTAEIGRAGLVGLRATVGRDWSSTASVKLEHYGWLPYVYCASTYICEYNTCNEYEE